MGLGGHRLGAFLILGRRGPALSVRPTPGAAATTIPRLRAHSRSNVSNCVPVASKTSRFGSRARSDPVKAVRSRIQEIRVNGSRRSTSRVVSASLRGTIVSLNEVICNLEVDIWAK